MLGLNYDDLKQRHRVERLKRRTFFTGIVFAVVLVFLFQSLYFVNTIQKQKLEIEKKYADSMANTSKELLRSGDRMTALYVARSVLPDEQNRGFGRIMRRFGMDELKRQGFRSVRFLVNKNNAKAIRSYAVFGFRIAGECHMYDQDLFCYEKEL